MIEKDGSWNKVADVSDLIIEIEIARLFFWFYEASGYILEHYDRNISTANMYWL